MNITEQPIQGTTPGGPIEGDSQTRDDRGSETKGKHAPMTEEATRGTSPDDLQPCEVCGNRYDKSFAIRRPADSNEERIFDSFECAIQALAPTCEACGNRIIGHGLESDGRFFCCAHCARQEGEKDLTDRT